jgi:hypothetical protein
MTDKKKILNELLKHNPELKNKKHSIKKLINILVKNNPNIKASKKFKNNLKNKLNSII